MHRLATTVLFLFASVALADARPAAELLAFEGKADIRQAGGYEWQPARHGQPLPARTTVRTGTASWASILFIDQTQIKLSSNALFQVKAVASSKAGKTIVEMRRGKAWMQSKAPPASFTMQTPAVNAGIEGTDWIVEVADDGTTMFSVLSGAIRCYNAQGEVRAGKNEEVFTVPGKAPIKRPLTNPRQRVQWVARHAIQWQRYPELVQDPQYADIVRAVKHGRNPEALRLLDAFPKEQRSAASRLLEADVRQSAGDMPQAWDDLTSGMREFSDDPRFPAALAQLALLMDRETEANRLLEDATARFPESAELWLARGDLARWQGQREQAVAAFDRAAKFAPRDSRPLLGLGTIASEREDFALGDRILDEAVEHSTDRADILAEHGWLKVRDDDLPAARRLLEEALAAAPDDYVALTGLGYLEIKRGRPESALDYLLKANTIEPRYARAVQTLGIAYYQLGHRQAAIDSMTRAAELDPRDPIPWFFLSLIYQDDWQPGLAVRAAQQGLARLPYLKSMNQLATDLRGSSNLGSGYALFGLEEWAMRMAQDSYDPFWAGSHFFLANRYAGEFARNSELTLGFLTDPTAFGTRGLWQPLVPVPGFHGGASYWHDQGGDERIDVPALRLNGYANPGMPLAGLLEAQHQSWEDDDLDADAGQFTLGLGAKPDSVLRMFLFGNRFKPDIKQDVTGGTEHISGTNRRFDVGIGLRHGPEIQTWLKAGHTREDSDVDGPNLVVPMLHERTELNPERTDVEFRHTRRFDERLELSIGAEWGRRKDNADYWLWDPSVPTPVSSGQDRSKDTSKLGYLSARLDATKDLAIQSDVTLIRLVTKTKYKARIGDTDLDRGDYQKRTRRLQLNLGGVYRPAAGWTLRTARQDWTRPVSFNTLSPIATAGIEVDDVYTLPGGHLERFKLQLERETNRSLSEAWADHRDIDNIAFDVLAGPDNGATELADLSRLDPRLLQSLALDYPEGVPLFSRGEIREWGVSHERVLNESLSLYLRYRHADSKNTRWFDGNELPYLPKHQGTVGMNWFPLPRWNLQARTDYRSARFADAANNVQLASGWDAALLTSWQSYRKNVQADLYVRSLFNDDLPTSVGAALSLRF
jgi:Flp pilus assembly protein TadD